MRTCVRVTSQGSPYPRFRRALSTGNLALVRAAARELPRVDLGDALAVCVLLADQEPARFERAAIRWLARFCLEWPAATVGDVARAADAFATMTRDREAGLRALQALLAAR
jgi:hypothetical protein